MKYAQKTKAKREKQKQDLIKFCEKANGHVLNKNITKSSKKIIEEYEIEYRMTTKEFLSRWEVNLPFTEDFYDWFRLGIK